MSTGLDFYYVCTTFPIKNAIRRMNWNYFVTRALKNKKSTNDVYDGTKSSETSLKSMELMMENTIRI